MLCLLCKEEVLPDDQVAAINAFDIDGNPTKIHYECGLRNVLGGIGHLEDHQKWCNELHDPDGGVSYRISSQLVVEWVKEHSLMEATRVGRDDEMLVDFEEIEDE